MLVYVCLLTDANRRLPAAELAPSGTYRWMQYRLERDVNGNLLVPALPQERAQCLFTHRNQTLATDGNRCARTDHYLSLVHAPGE